MENLATKTITKLRASSKGW